MKTLEVILAANRYFGVEIRSSCRKKTVSLARQIAVYIMSKEFSYPEIADCLHRDTTTLMFAVKKINADLPRYQADIDGVMSRIRKEIHNVEDILIEAERGIYTPLEKYYLLRGFLIAQL